MKKEQIREKLKGQLQDLLYEWYVSFGSRQGEKKIEQWLIDNLSDEDTRPVPEPQEGPFQVGERVIIEEINRFLEGVVVCSSKTSTWVILNGIATPFFNNEVFPYSESLKEVMERKYGEWIIKD